MKKVFLIRGLPGSGKSTKAKELVELYKPQCKEVDPAHLETDRFFARKTSWNETGEYKFVPEKLGIAHHWNLNRFKDLIDLAFEVVIVSNTFTIKSELKPYVEYAHSRNYEIELLESSTPWAWDVEECFKKNIHGVPKESIQKMLNRFQRGLTVEEILS